MAKLSDQNQVYQSALKSLGSQADQIKDKISGGLEKIKDGKLPTELGISLLDVKYHLLLDYMTNLSFYSLLKAQGKAVEGHPVILKLVELRTHIEKIKPVEAKLKYQIDKLVRAANTGATKESAALLEKDPLQFKPNPENLVNDAAAENEDEDEDKVYRAPRIAPMPFDDRPLSSKKERDEMRQKEKAARSRLMKDLVNDFDDRPEEHRVIGSFNETEDSELADRKRYEEENFIRLQPSKKADRKVREMQKGQLQNELLTLDDFRGVSSIDDMAHRAGNVGVLDRALGRARANEADNEQQSKQMKRAMKSTDHLFNNVITEPGQSSSGSHFKRAKSNFKNKQKRRK